MHMPGAVLLSRGLRCAAAAVALGTALNAYSAIAWPNIPLPPSTRGEKVGDEMRVNGLPMRATAFESALAPQDVIKFYQTTWRGRAGQLSDEKRVADWTVVSYTESTFHTTVQVRPRPNGAGSIGYIGTTSRDGTERPDFSARGLPQPAGARVLSAVESDDPGRTSVQVTMMSPMSVSSSASYYESSLRRDGWTPELRPKPGKTAGVDPIYATYNRGPEQLDVVFSRDPASGQTYINANRVRPK
ncbi:hypothetical protein [Ralstonia mannitolilytica]|uniref:hypothetical protein n=2 Tax=Ralstonia mannitolilytica TaxID=105219 RepID=UPI0007AFEB4F|nr:hypothetical protein [Ralstonia mannitolilytica]ANA33593.1 hypothetical protein VZ52_09400 [Ralstonia mannitolilytica]CAJ0890924.1 hypothetical protein R76727_04223 [Ralstonia mannitolilytica]